MAIYQDNQEDNDMSYIDQIEKILDGIDNNKSMRGQVTILQPKQNTITQKTIKFEKDNVSNKYKIN